MALQGYDANLTLGPTKSVDILVSDPKAKKMFKLEVKTKYRKGSKKSTKSKLFGEVVGKWIMHRKHESIGDPSLFYCFAIICEPTDTFQFYIVPSKVVAKYVQEEHQLFRKKREERGKDTDMRMFRFGFKGKEYPIVTPLAESYDNNWKLLRS